MVDYVEMYRRAAALLASGPAQSSQKKKREQRSNDTDLIFISLNDEEKHLLNAGKKISAVSLARIAENTGCSVAECDSCFAYFLYWRNNSIEE